MRELAVYTLLRLGLFAVAFAVLGGLWWLVVGPDLLLVVPFLLALVVSALLSWRFLAGPRARLAEAVERGRRRTADRYDAMRSKEDDDPAAPGGPGGVSGDGRAGA